MPQPDARKTALQEYDRFRLAQAKRVMPVVGPLLDEWEGISNDVTSTLEEEAPALVALLDMLAKNVENR